MVQRRKPPQKMVMVFPPLEVVDSFFLSLPAPVACGGGVRWWGVCIHYGHVFYSMCININIYIYAHMINIYIYEYDI